MKVLLINPTFYNYGGMKVIGGSLIPLNLCYLASYARRENPEVEFRILDAEIRGLSMEETASETFLYSPQIVGITATTGAFDSIIELVTLIKRELPSIKVLLGGPHPSALPERSLRETGADYVVIGEGELTFAEFIEKAKNASGEEKTIDGLAYLDRDGVFRRNQPRHLITDLDRLPSPARDLVDNTLYCPPPSKRVASGPNTLISSSRGCPHNCGFCANRAVWGRITRWRSPESVVAEIQECVEKFGIASVNFADEFFTARKDRIKRICHLMVEQALTIPWVCSARAEGLDEEIIKAMKAANCREISFGIESGNPEVLKKIDKKVDLREAERVVRLVQKHGITTHANYIIGYPGETVESIKDTMRFARKLNTDVAAFFIASPLPGSRLYEQAREEGCISPCASWKNYSPLSNQDNILELPGLSIKEIRYWHRKAIRAYYLRFGYLISRLWRIRHPYEIANLIGGLKIFLSIKK